MLPEEIGVFGVFILRYLITAEWTPKKIDRPLFLFYFPKILSKIYSRETCFGQE